MTRTTDPGVPCSGPGVIRRMFARESLIVWVLLVALAIRVLALLSYGVKYNAAEDAQGYFDSAAVLAHTGKLTFYGKWPSAITMPGFVALLSVPIRLTQDPTSQYLLVKAVLILLSLASVYIVYLLGQRIGGTPTGLLAAGLLSVSPASIYVANATYVENGVMPVVLLLILLVIRMADEPTPQRIAVCIAVFCVGLYVREVVAVVALLSLGYLAMRGYPPAKLARFSALAGLAAVLALMPWWIRNYGAFGCFIPFTSNGSSPFFEGTFQTFQPYRTGSMEAIDKLLRSFHGSLQEQNRLLFRAGLQRIGERWRLEPGRLLFTYAVSKPVAACLSIKSLARAEFLYFLLIVLAMTLASAVYLGLSRYIYPFMPLLYIAVAYGATRLPSIMSARRNHAV